MYPEGMSGIAVYPLSCLTGSADYRRTNDLPTPAELGQMARDGITVFFVNGHTGEVEFCLTAPTAGQLDALGPDRARISQGVHRKLSDAARVRRRRTLDAAVSAAHAARTLEGTFHD